MKAKEALDSKTPNRRGSGSSVHKFITFEEKMKEIQDKRQSNLLEQVTQSKARLLAVDD